MNETRLQTGLRYAMAFLLAAGVLCTINIPSHAMVADPRIGTSEELKRTADPTQAQLEKQQADPKVMAPVHNDEPEVESVESDIPSGSEPSAVMAALEGAKQKKTARARPAQEKKSTTLLGLALTAAILGALCGGGMLVVKFGPKPPPPAEHTDEDM